MLPTIGLSNIWVERLDIRFLFLYYDVRTSLGDLRRLVILRNIDRVQTIQCLLLNCQLLPNLLAEVLSSLPSAIIW